MTNTHHIFFSFVPYLERIQTHHALLGAVLITSEIRRPGQKGVLLHQLLVQQLLQQNRKELHLWEESEIEIGKQ